MTKDNSYRSPTTKDGTTSLPKYLQETQETTFQDFLESVGPGQCVYLVTIPSGSLVDSRLVEGLMRKFMNQKSGLRKFADSCTYSVTTETVGPSPESGSRTIADRFNNGKPDLVYLLDFPEAIRELAEVAEYGANKYSRHNWKKGLKVRSVASSLLRHLAVYIDGEDVDGESGLPHTGAIVWNAMVLAEMAKRFDMDDRDRSVE